MGKMKIKKGDKVIILSGKDRTKTGIIERVSAKGGKVIVTGLNLVKKNVKVSKKNPSGGKVDVAMPMPASKIQLICPNCNKTTRISYKTEGKEKTRFCRKCDKAIRSKDVSSK